MLQDIKKKLQCAWLCELSTLLQGVSAKTDAHMYWSRSLAP